MSAGSISFMTSANKAKMVFKPKKHLAAGLVKVVVDLADIAAVKGSAAAASDTIDIIKIKAGTLVKRVFTRVLIPVAGGSVSSPTAAIGDQSAASFQAATAVDAAAQTVAFGKGAYLQAATDPYAVTGGRFFGSDDAIQVTLGGTWTGATAGRFEVYVELEELGSSLFV